MDLRQAHIASKIKASQVYKITFLYMALYMEKIWILANFSGLLWTDKMLQGRLCVMFIGLYWTLLDDGSGCGGWI